MKWDSKSAYGFSIDDERTITRFALFPIWVAGVWYWLETITFRQRVVWPKNRFNGNPDRWMNVKLITKDKK